MTWALTPEEEFDPLLVPPVAMEYPRPLPEAEVPYLVGSPDLNKWYSATEYGYPSQGYAGPATPVMGDQRPTFNERLRYGRGKMPSAYEADYPQSFFPEVVDSYEAIFNRQPAGSTQERMWSGSDARFDMTYAGRRPTDVYPSGGDGSLSALSPYIRPTGYRTEVADPCEHVWNETYERAFMAASRFPLINLPGRPVGARRSPDVVAREAANLAYNGCRRSLSPQEDLRHRVGLQALGEEIDPTWYETPVGAVGLALGVGVVSYFATRAFLRSKDRKF